MAERLEDIIKARRKKLQEIKAAGLDPYPSTTVRTHTNRQVLEEFDKLEGKTLTLVGRIRSWRDMGKLVFAHVEDGTGRIQVLFKSDLLGDNQFQFLLDYFDIGDFVEISGTLFKTKTGEKTLQAQAYKMLAKSLRPLPSEHYGLQDEEQRLRKRYLDILTHPEVKELFVKKNKFWTAIREFLVKHDFLELQLPVLEALPGGAEAEPFVTHYNALNQDVYLRISLELPLKKMLVAGYEKVFEIGRVFRNEGISSEHLQDYTAMEFYWAYADFNQLMDFVQAMYQYVIKETFGSLELNYQGQIVNWGGQWPKLDYFELFKKYTGIDLSDTDEQVLKQYAQKHNIQFEPFAGKGRLIDLIFKKTVRVLPEVSLKPAFLVNQPVEIEPLAKRDPKNPKIVQRMQILACGSELGKGFGELNDPVDQRARFEEQMKLRQAGDKEAQRLDEDYVEAMEYGMPPAAGFGLSERLFAVLCDKPVRETVVFPPMRS